MEKIFRSNTSHNENTKKSFSSFLLCKKNCIHFQKINTYKSIIKIVYLDFHGLYLRKFELISFRSIIPIYRKNKPPLTYLQGAGKSNQ